MYLTALLFLVIVEDHDSDLRLRIRMDPSQCWADCAGVVRTRAEVLLRSWPTLAKPTLANFFDRLWPIFVF